MPPNPVDHRIYADAGPKDAIDLEWYADTTENTTGYLLFRSNDDTVGSDGLLKNRVGIAQLETTNQLISPVPTSYQDTANITPGATYYYQLQAYYRSPSNTLTYSPPTHVDRSTSFTYAKRVQLLFPYGVDTLHGFPPTFRWQDPNNGGQYQIIVQQQEDGAYVFSYDDNGFGNPVELSYPSGATPLVAGTSYQWRVKWLAAHGGSSSTWMVFSIVP